MKFRLVETIVNESKQDQGNFINKFGKEAFDFFQKYAQRIKNAGITTDIVWHTKNTSPLDMHKIITELENKVVKDAETGETKLNRKYIGRGNGYEVYQPLDWETSMNMGDGTGWCITGRYNTDEVKPSQAKQYFEEYTGQGVKFYFFMKDGWADFCIALYPTLHAQDNRITTNFDLWNVEDENVTEFYDKIDLPYNLLPELSIEKNEFVDGMYITQSGIVTETEVDTEDAVIPDGVREIGAGAFANCYLLKRVVIPDSVTSIGDKAFYYCESLPYVLLPDGVSKIDRGTFMHTGLRSITIPNNIKLVDSYSFYGCDRLTLVTIDKDVEKFGGSVFMGCPLKSIVYTGTLDEFRKVVFSGSIFEYEKQVHFTCADNKDVLMVMLSNGDIMDETTGEILSMGRDKELM